MLRDLGRSSVTRNAVWTWAQSTCAVCHGTRKGETSANRQAPPFDAIAQVKGMSAMALNVALLSSHRSMPNIVLDAKERADLDCLTS